MNKLRKYVFLHFFIFPHKIFSKEFKQLLQEIKFKKHEIKNYLINSFNFI